jgi:hypothetical protein
MHIDVTFFHVYFFKVKVDFNDAFYWNFFHNPYFEMIDINVSCNCESYGLKCIYINFENKIYFNENDSTWMLIFFNLEFI